MNIRISAIVMAGGKGTRMQSELPKVLHLLDGEPMIYHSLRILEKLYLTEIVTVIGYKADEVKQAINSKFKVNYGLQNQPLGTGDALNVGLLATNSSPEHVLVVNGDDSAFYDPATLQAFIDSHLQTGAVVSLMTLIIDEGLALGRVIRHQNGDFKEILEHESYQKSGLNSPEINCGAYIFDRKWVEQVIDRLTFNEKGEYYITELPDLAQLDGKVVNLFNLTDKNQWVGVNTQADLAKARSLKEKNKHV